MARTNGGIIGKTNKTSFGKCTVTSKTSTGCVSLQSGTRVIETLIVAGGGGGGGFYIGGGGGGGGFRDIEVNASGTVPVTVGSGGSGGAPAPPGKGTDGNDSNLIACGVTYTSTGGGAGGWESDGNPGGSGGGGSYTLLQVGQEIHHQ
jgi:hypothetical protein